MPSEKIQHLVVLMLENRSFDHMLGFLKKPDYPIDGLEGTEFNRDSDGEQVFVNDQADYAGDLDDDPGHHFEDTIEQMFGSREAFEAGRPPDMSGFVRAYETKTRDRRQSHRIMRCFAPGKLPALATLAREFCLCERWFSSVPGPTLPNRAYAHSGTSVGRLDISPIWFDLTRTVYELLAENGREARIYYQDFTMALTFRGINKDQKKFFGRHADFLRACKKDKLPAYSFVEPRYYNDAKKFIPANDQHPDNDVFAGDELVREVYEAIRSNEKVWHKTLLAIVYDEHGGIYDHVPPPRTANPDGRNCTRPPFDFTWLGVRVPAVLVSPYIERGTIDRTVYEHTSVIATARKLFLNNWQQHALTERDRAARTFDHVLTRAVPRGDTVQFPPERLAAGPTLPSPDRGLTELQKVMIQQARYLEDQLPPGQRTDIAPETIQTEAEAAEYIREVEKRLRRRKKAARA